MKKRQREIKAVIFDVGGVLSLGPKVRLNQKNLHISGIHEKFAKKLKITVDQYFDAIDTAYSKSMCGKITKFELLKILEKNLEYPREKIEKFYFKEYKKRYNKNKKLYKIAEKIKKQGIKISILSDQWLLSKDAQMPKKQIKIFEPVIVSCDVGMRKPDTRIYELILKKLKLKPEETIFIDNQVWNIMPANKLGMNTILFVNNQKTRKELEKFGIKL